MKLTHAGLVLFLCGISAGEAWSQTSTYRRDTERICARADEISSDLNVAKVRRKEASSELQTIREQYRTERERVAHGSGRLRAEIRALDARIRTLETEERTQRDRCEVARTMVTNSEQIARGLSTPPLQGQRVHDGRGEQVESHDTAVTGQDAPASESPAGRRSHRVRAQSISAGE